MSFKLNSKTFLFQLLEKFPEKMGNRLYHKIQELFSEKSINHKIEESKNTYFDFQKLTGSLKIPISGKTLIEIGSGWLPIMPYFFKYLGKMRAVETYDLNKHYNQNSIRELNRLFAQKFNVNVETSVGGKYPLPRDIKYHPNTNLIHAQLPFAEIVFSRFVFEHVSPLDIKNMHLKFKKELKPGSHIIHYISPGDHRAYVDKSLSLQDFLQYSQAEWKKKYNRFDYHNRLRLPQYIEIFESLGFEIIHLEYSNPPLDSEVHKKFKSIILHPDFKKFSDEELTAGAINIVLKT
jgi:hypothetical protein